jgi:hypothetical protein
VEKLGEPLSVQSAKRANEGPMLAEMLKELESKPGSPMAIVAQLRKFRDVAWKAATTTAESIHYRECLQAIRRSSRMTLFGIRMR